MKMLVDVDSTLCNSHEAFRKVAATFQVEWPEEPRVWLNTGHLNTDSKTMFEIFDAVHGELLKDMEPYSGAVDCIKKITDEYKWVEPWYVSNRNAKWHVNLVEWLKSHDFPFADQTHTSFDKFEWIEQERPEIVIDDRVRTMIRSHYEFGCRVFSIVQPWNINLLGEIEEITLCENWNELYERLAGTFKL